VCLFRQLNLSNNCLCDVWDDDSGRLYGDYTSEGINAIADAFRVNGALTALNLSSNSLEDEGVSAVCKAIQSNKETKLASLNFENNGIGPVGASAVAAMVAVTGALTVTNLLRNQLDEASAKMLAEVAKQKGISLCGIRRDQTTANFSNQNLELPDVILLASDLSQADVTGGLTKMSLAKNKLGEEGIKAICEALKQNKTLKEFDLSGYNNIGGEAGAKHVADMIGVNGALTQVLALRPPECLSCYSNPCLCFECIAAGPLKQRAVRARSSWARNLHCRGDHSDCRRSARQWRADQSITREKPVGGGGHQGHLRGSRTEQDAQGA
jgi:hypothetical protein